jgi:hypothetical protein
MNCPGLGAGCGLGGGLGDTAATTTDSWWQKLISGAATTAENILTAKNQTTGVYTKNADGSVTYVQPAGNTSNVFSASSTGVTGSATGTSSMGLILVGGAALLMVFLLAKGKG